MLFPKKENEEMPDRVWETYCCLVWCCNSMNATAGRYKYSDPHAASYMLRAQSVITHLLDETGRLEEFHKWENERKPKLCKDKSLSFMQ